MGGNKHPDFVIILLSLVYDPSNLSVLVSLVDSLKDFLLMLTLNVGQLVHLPNPPCLDIT